MEIPSSITATIALLLFISIGLVLVMTDRPIYAVLVLTLGGTLFLPVGAGFDFPAIPSLGGRTLPYVILVLATVVLWPHKLRGIDLGRWPDLVIVLICVAPIITARLNTDVISWGPRSIQGLTNWDGFSAASRTFMDVGLPYLVGRALFHSSSDLRRLMIWLAGAGLIYSLLALVEMRLSPQLHYWVYGYHPHEVRFQMRWGGYRPMVFLVGGLAVGLFMMVTSVVGLALGRARLNVGFVPYRLVGPYLLVILVLCKSVAAIGYGLLLAPVVAWMRPRSIHLVAVALSMVVIFYPLLRTQDLIPTAAIVDTAASMSPERADSLLTRFDNEDRMLSHNWDRFFFGWGGYGRNRVYDTRDGRDITLTDGQWMILLSTGGFVEWACFYILLLWPVLLGIRQLPRIRGPDQVLMASLLLVVSVFALDHLLNGFFMNLPFVLAGASLTLLKLLPRESSPGPDVGPPKRPSEAVATAEPSPSSLSSGLLGAGPGR